MRIVGEVLSALLYLFLLFLIGRLVLDYVRQFARSWHPTGVVLVLAEVTYSVTEPPLKLLRRFIPNVRLGNLAFDLSFTVLFLLVLIMITFVQTV
ncbi:MAG TPA: YggT family protein [Streptosporangiaceae bacterium]|nr:YggT family protein [Streptosporangiaceae bacterium]